MADNSKIQWTENTWNPWHGCRKVSPGCKFCYMYRDKERYRQDPTTVLRSKTFNDPLKWQEPKLIFTCSWSDWFIEEADDWRAEAWAIIKATPQHTYQILTKRAERINQCLPADWGNGYPNVWLGVSAEDNENYIERVSQLIQVPAAVRFVSAEPLLGPIWEPTVAAFYQGIDWVIIGGESGNDNGKYTYRPMDPMWLEEIYYACHHYGVPVFIKQLGTWLSKEWGLKDRHGGDITEWPEVYQVRQMPTKYEKA